MDFDPELLLEMLQDPAMAEALSQMGVYRDRQTLLGQQAQRGAGMMATPGAQGMRVGDTYVASHPLEHLGVALQRGIGAAQTARATGGQQALTDQDAATRQTFASAMARAMRRAQQPEPEADEYFVPPEMLR